MFTSPAAVLFGQSVQSRAFAQLSKELAIRVERAISRDLRENQLVEGIVNEINRTPLLQFRDNDLGLSMETRSAFIHGNHHRQVEYKYLNGTRNAEMGDLLLNILVYFEGQRCFEKATFVQFKKSKGDEWKWALPTDHAVDATDANQLYLLSRFPPLRGRTDALFQRRNFLFVPNHSECLGSYGLIHKPGDLIFISAPRLEACASSQDATTLHSMRHLKTNAATSWSYMFGKTIPEGSILGNIQYAQNAYDLIDKYLRLSIGESVVSDNGLNNPAASNLVEHVFSYLAEKQPKQYAELLKMRHGQRRNMNISNIEDTVGETGKGGLGILTTRIDLSR